MSDQAPWEEFSAAPQPGSDTDKPWEAFGGTTAPEGKGFVGQARDLGISTLEGAIGVPESAVGLADLASGGQAGKILENQDGAVGFRPKQARDYLESLHTDQYKDQQQQFHDADGVLAKTGVALQNPSLIANSVAQSLPIMWAGGVVARGLGAVAPAVMAVGDGALAGAIGEGVSTAGQDAEQMRQETPDGQLTPIQVGANVAIGAATTLFGFASGKMAQKLGIGDVNTMLARGITTPTRIAENFASMPAKSIPRQVIEGALQEGLLEELPQSISEQVIQNLATDKPWHEGVDEAAVMGTLAGMVMGGPAAGVKGFSHNREQAKHPADAANAAPDQYDYANEDQTNPYDDVAPVVASADSPIEPAPAQSVEPIPREPVAPTRSQQMGLDPAAGPISAAAAIAVDSGAHDHAIEQAAAQQAEVAPAKPGKKSAEPITAAAAPLPETKSAPPAGVRGRSAEQTEALSDDALLARIRSQFASGNRLNSVDFAKATGIDTERAGRLRARVVKEVQVAQVKAGNVAILTTPYQSILSANRARVRLKGEGVKDSYEPVRIGDKHFELRLIPNERTSNAPAQKTSGVPAANESIPAGAGEQEAPSAEPAQAETLSAHVDGEAISRKSAMASIDQTDSAALEQYQVGQTWRKGKQEYTISEVKDGGKLAVAKQGKSSFNVGLDAEIANGWAPDAQAQAEPKPAATAPAPASPIEAAAHEAATSPHNDLPQPTDAQKEAGNYAKGHVSVHGLDITIENPQGSTRSGKREDGSTWSHEMSDHYGYIKRTVGADDEQIDVYVGPNPESPYVFVVDQLNQKDGSFDEHKIMLGFAGKISAVRAYKSNFDKGWKVGPVTSMSIDQFKEWLKGDTSKPVNDKTGSESDSPKIDRQAVAKAEGATPTRASAKQGERAYRITSNGNGKFILENDESIEAGNGDGSPREFATTEAAAAWAKSNGYEIAQELIDERDPAPVKESPESLTRPAPKEGKPAKSFVEDGELSPAFAPEESDQAEQFVAAPNGSVNFGEITAGQAKAIGRQAGKIRLQQGEHRADGTGYGLAHIEAKHGKQIKNAGFESVEQFVSRVAESFDQIRTSKGRQLLVAINGDRQGVMYVQLEPAQRGDYYRINTAFPASRDYLEKQERNGSELLWDGSEPTSTVAGKQPLYADSPESPSGQAAPIAQGQSKSNDTPKPVKDKSGDITDTGDSLYWNRKNPWRGGGLQWADVADQNETLRLQMVQKAKVWAKPDWETILADTPENDRKPLTFIARLVKGAYDAIPNQPNGTDDASLQRYIEALTTLRDAATKLLTDRSAMVAAMGAIGERISKSKSRYTRSSPGMLAAEPINLSDLIKDSEGEAAQRALIQPLMAALFPQSLAAKSSRIHAAEAATYQALGKKAVDGLQWGADEFVKAMRDIETGWPAKQEAWQRQGYIVVPGDSVNAHYYSGTHTDRSAYTSASIRIGGLSDFSIESKSFPTPEEARAWGDARVEELKSRHLLLNKRKRMLSDHTTEAEAKEAARALTKRDSGDKLVDEAVAMEGLQRIGEDRRAPTDNIAPDQLATEFGLRGVNFGNYVKQDERQAHLNHAYDALHDLAALLDVPARAVGMNGMLGIAFGAQGNGGKHAAHFVPGVNEINLTKDSGAGALAHEWAHALDHYFGVKGGLAKHSEPFASWLGSYHKTSDSTIRPEIKAAFKTIVDTMRSRLETTEEAQTRADNHLKKEEADLQRYIEQKGIREKLAGNQAALDALTQIEAGNPGDYVEVPGQSPRKKKMNKVFASDNVVIVSTAAGFDLAMTARFNMEANSYRFAKEQKEKGPEQMELHTDFYRTSSALDGGKKPYWSTKHEMFARAFESWVYAKLAGNEQRSDYLVRGNRADLEKTDPDFPYPAAAERKAINDAFTTLVDAIETNEADGGAAMFRRTSYRPAETRKGTQAEAVRRALSTITKGWNNAPRITVVQSIADLPAALRDRIQGAAALDAEGSFYEGQVYLIADNLGSIQHATFVLAHEVLGHSGLQGLFGERLNPMLTGIYRDDAAMRAAADWLMQKFGYSKAVAVEEVLADMAAANRLDQQKFFPRLLMAIRSALRALGLDLKWTGADINGLLANARRHVEGGNTGPANAATRFRRAIQAHSIAFKRWFGSSKVVDANGEPLVVYHGTSNSDITGDAFKFFDTYASNYGLMGMGGYFTADPDVASSYTSKGKGITPTVYPVYLSIKNPIDMESEANATAWTKEFDGIEAFYEGGNTNEDWYRAAEGMLADEGLPKWEGAERMQDGVRNMGFDGITHIGGGRRKDAEARHRVYIAFDPEQIKSATGNNGDFDPSNPDIRYSRAGMGDLVSRATSELNKTFNAPGKLSKWHTTVGSMYNLAERSPAFKPVFNAAQSFIEDVSYYAADAADLAPKLLPKLETWRDIGKSPVSAEDNKAVTKPIFEGTLSWARDESGKPARVETLAQAATRLSANDKAEALLRNNKIPEGMLKAWRGLGDEQFGKMIDSRYESQLLKPGIVWTDAELQSFFSLNDSQIALYHEFREATNRSLDTMARADMLRFGGEDVKDLRDAVMEAPSNTEASRILVDRLKELAGKHPDRETQLMATASGMVDRVNKVAQLQAEGYAPLSRFGKYTVDVVTEGERQYFGLFETAREANNMAEQMAEEFGAANVSQGTLSNESYKLFAGITPESLELFGNMLGLDATGDNAQDQAFQEYLRLTKTNRSAMRRLIHRKGIAGFSEDAGRVLASFVYSNARQTAAGLHMGDLGDAVNAIPKQQGELKDVAVKLTDYIKNPQEEAQAVRGLLFAQYLGGSVSSALVNMTQPLAVTFPWLSQYGGARKAAGAIAMAAKNIANKNFTYEPDLATAIKHAEDDGVVSPQEVHQLMAQARGNGSLRAGDGTRAGNAAAFAQNSLARISVAWGKLFGAAEQLNRRITFIAAFRVAKDKGIENPDEFARKAVKETQFVYSKASKMQWGRGAVGGTLMTFKTYSVAYLELMSRLWSQGEKGSQERKDGRKAAMLMVATLMLLGGAGGLPFADDAADAIDGAAQLMGYSFSTEEAKREFLENVFGAPLAHFIDHGISGLPGAPLDISGRLGMGNLIPGTGLLKESTDHTRDVMEIAGPAGDFAGRILSGARSILSGDIGTGLLQAAPTAVRNAAKGVDMAATGMYRDAKGYKVLDASPLDAALKMIGFQPEGVARIQEANALNQTSKAFYNMRAQGIRSMWAAGVFEKDSAKVQEARQAIADWNEKNPDQPMHIRVPDVMRRAREMGKSKDQRIADTAPKAMRAKMKEDAARLRREMAD